MSYLLGGATIRRPMNLEETNSTQFAQVRTLSGAVGRDLFGSNKRVWAMDFVNTNPTDYTTIKSIYDTYLSSGTAQTWESTETNYIVAQTTVHIDLTRRRFSVKGVSYISDFTLILTEA